MPSKGKTPKTGVLVADASDSPRRSSADKLEAPRSPGAAYNDGVGNSGDPPDTNRNTAAAAPATNTVDADLASRVTELARANRKLAELREAERAHHERANLLLGAIVESSSDAIFSISPQGLITSWNAAAERMFGYRAEEVIGRSHEILLTPDQLGELDAIRARLDNGPIRDHEARRNRKDGTLINLSASLFRIIGRGGERLGVCVVLRDLTDRKRAERELRASEQKFRDIFRFSLDAIAINTLAGGRYLDVNDEFLRRTGLTRQQVIGRRGDEVEFWEDPAEQQRFTSKLLRYGVVRNFEARFRVSGGRLKVGLISAVLAALNGEQVMISISRDITEHQRAKRQLQETQHRLQEVLANAPIAVSLTDRDGIFILSEGRGLGAIGLKPGEIVGTSVFDGPHSDPEVAKLARRALDGETFEATVKLGETFFDCWFAPLRGAGGEPIGALSVGTDVTAREHAEAELRARLRQQEALAELGRAALTKTPIDALMNLALTAVRETLSLEFAWIFELQEDERTLLLRAGLGMPSETIGAFQADLYGPSQAGYTLRCGESVIVEDLRAEVRFEPPQALLERGAVSGVSAVIAEPRGAFGVLGAHSKARRGFDRHDVNFIEAVANILAGAIGSRRAEHELRRSGEYYRSLLEDSSDVISVVDLDGTLLFESGAVKSIFGRERLATPGYNSFCDVHPDDLAAALKAFRSAVEAPGCTVTASARFSHDDGHWVECELAGKRIDDADGKPVIVINLRDVSARRRAEAEHALLASIVESSEEGITSIGLDGRILTWNRGAELMTGYGAAEVIGRDAAFLIPPDLVDEGSRQLRQFRRGETVRQHETRRMRKDGSQIHLSINVAPIRSAAGKVTAVAAIAHDISERRRAEAALARARDEALEASRLKSAFVANMSHEIRTPLNIILGYSEIVAEHLDDSGDDSQAAFFEGIKRAGRRLLTTIQGVLDFSRIEANAFELKPVRIPLAPLLESLMSDLKVLAEAKGLTLMCEIKEPSATITFDEYCLQNSLLNLLQNAVKFTAAGTVTARLGRSAAGALFIEVADTGVGIEPDFIPRIFEPFSQEDMGFTRQFEGSGLGLALTRRYLELNGARIAVSSRKGGGSAFTVEIPRAVEDAPAAAPVPQGGAGELGPELRGAILVVEDDADTQAFMKAMLAPRYQVVVAADGVAMRRELESGAHRFAAVLMDLSLAQEDGLTLTRQLRAHPRFSDLTIVAVTANAMPEHRQSALNAGCDDFLAKPVTRGALFGALERLLSESGARAAGAAIVRPDKKALAP